MSPLSVLVAMWRVALASSAVIRHSRTLTLPPTMNHPGQRVTRSRRQEKGQQWALSRLLPETLLAFTVVAFACLADVVRASPIYLMGCSGRLICNVVERLPHLIKNMLGRALLRSALLVIRR